MVKKLGGPIIPDGIECYSDCALCPKLCDNSLNVCMEGDGPSNAKLMIIGEAPGFTEDELNLPLMGQAGEYLRDDLLTEAGIPESEVRFTNSVRCHPPNKKKSQITRSPTALELRKCRKYLEAEIKRVKPRVIIGLGNAPLATLLQRFYKGAQEEGTAKKSEKIVGGIIQWQGHTVWLREFNCWFIPTFHPTYCICNEQKHSMFSTNLVIKDLKKGWKLAQKPLPKMEYPKAHVVTDPSKARQVLMEMQEAGTFAFDIETGVDEENPRIPKIIGCSFAKDTKEGYYIPWSLLEDKRTKWFMYSTLGNPRLYKLMHHGAYELRVLRFNNIPISDRYFDTMIAAHHVDENFPKRLKALTWLYTNFGGYDIPLEKYKYENKIKGDYSRLPFKILAPYGALDSVATFAIYEKLKHLMYKENLLPLFNKVSMPVRRVMSGAEYSGIHVDVEQAEAVNKACQIAKEKLTDAIYGCAGRTFNIKSTQQLAKLLYKDMGFKPLKKTKTGYGVDKDSIEYVSTQPGADIAKYISDLGYVHTMVNTHIAQALNFRWESDSRIHQNYNSTGAVTGRTSASNPSLQNVPVDKLVRSIYTATPGNYLIEGDLKSAELATIAALSGEELFLEAFNNGLDPHAQTYRRMYNLPDSYIPTKAERKSAKTINFGLVYGITVIRLAARLGITVEAAQAFMDLYFERLPNIKIWMDRQKAFVRQHGYVISVFNRKRRLPLALSDSWGDISRAERQAMNAPVQSGAADYTYIGLIRLFRILKQNKRKSKIVHTVHDCGLTDTPPEEKSLVIDAFHEAFETPVNVLPVKMKVDIDVGYRWGEHNESRLQEIFDKFDLKVT